jgi:hypothetical protein
MGGFERPPSPPTLGGAPAQPGRPSKLARDPGGSGRPQAPALNPGLNREQRLGPVRR